jgi:hypothetical protein
MNKMLRLTLPAIAAISSATMMQKQPIFTIFCGIITG